LPPSGVKSDYQAVCEVSKKLGKYEEVTEGKTDAELIRAVFDGMEFNRFVSWEEFEEKGYFVIPVAPDWEQDPAGLYLFYKDPVANPLPTPTGKLEFYSESLARHFPRTPRDRPFPSGLKRA